MRHHNYNNQFGQARSVDEIVAGLRFINQSTNGRLVKMIDQWKTDPDYDPQSFNPADFLGGEDYGTGAKYVVYIFFASGTLKQWETYLEEIRNDGTSPKSLISKLKKFINAAKKKKKGGEEVLYFSYIGETTRGILVRAAEHIVHAHKAHGGSPNLSAFSDGMNKSKSGISFTHKVLFAIDSHYVNDANGIDPWCQDMIKFAEAVFATLVGAYVLNVARCGWWWKGKNSTWRLFDLIQHLSSSSTTRDGPLQWDKARKIKWSSISHDDECLDLIVEAEFGDKDPTVYEVWHAFHVYAGKAAQAVYKAGTFLIDVFVGFYVLLTRFCNHHLFLP